MTPERSDLRWTARIARLVLRFYPADVRDRDGDGVVDAYLTLVRLSRRRGWLHGLVAWTGGLVDLILGIGLERRRASRVGRRGVWGRARVGMADRVVHDVRLALRGLTRRPLFVLVASGSLAIGIGATTAVFSVANVLLLRPLPGMAHYDRVVELGRTSDGRGFDTFTYPDLQDIRQEISSLEAVAPYTIEVVSVSTGVEGVRGTGLLVGADYFDVLGAVPSMGRFFVPSEDEGVGEHPVVVISHRYWRSRLGSDSEVLGSTIFVNRIALEVVGVTEERFAGHMIGLTPDVFVPMVQAPAIKQQPSMFDHRGASWVLALARRSERTTVEAVDTQLAGLAARLADAFPETNARRGFRAMPVGPIPGAGRGGVTLFVTALLGMVGLVLLVTCTNVAGMSLARSTAREREFAIRTSLGAGRRLIVQQLTIETLLVFALGGGAGIALGSWLVASIRPDLLPLPVPIDLSIRPDGTVVGAAVLTTLLTGLLFGVLPALRSSRLDLNATLRDDGRGTFSGAGRLRAIFAGCQVGLSLVLLVTAGLFVRSLQMASADGAGFEPDGAFVTYLDLALEGYQPVEGRDFQRRLLESLRAEPWVGAATVASDLPLDLASRGTSVRPEGWEAAPDAELLGVDFNEVSPGYFEALGIAVNEGRTIADGDVVGAPRVAVVSEQFVATAWPGGDAVGRTFRLGRATDVDSLRYEVVGVVGDVKNQVVNEASKPFVYFPLAQRYNAQTQIVVRTSATESQAVEGIRAVLVAADPVMSRGPIVPLDAYTSVGLLPQRIAAGLTSALALVALLLSALGIYGVISFAVGTQRREIGIRLALGAEAGAVVRRLVRRGVLLAAPGFLVGGVLALGVGRLIRSLLLDLSPTDPVVFVSVTALLLAVVAAAAWIPARRAAWVDPADSLRRD